MAGRTGDETGGHAGNRARASGGSGAGGTARGGAGGDARGGAGGDALGGAGDANAGDTSAGDGGGSTAGTSASGGVVSEGLACDHPGALACPDADATGWMICDGTAWHSGGSCGHGDYCDQRNGTCAPPFSIWCDPNQPGNTGSYCQIATSGADELVVCSPDFVSADIEECTFECRNGIGCLPPTGDEVLLEPAPPPVEPVRAYWPGPAIPTCLTNPEQDGWSDIEDEIARTWGRYAGIAFTGFGACDSNATGVIATLETRTCENELGAVDRVGYPGPSGAVHVSICTTYLDASNDVQTATPDLLRLVARHEFGHVLGFDDAPMPDDPSDFMARGIHTQGLDQYPFTDIHIGMLVEAYGRKPAGALVDERGDCLSFANGELGFTTCDGSATQVFTFAGGELANPSTGLCVSSSLSTAATPAPCTSGSPAGDQAWQPAAVEIRGFGGLCLQSQDNGEDNGGGGGEPSVFDLTVDDCPTFGTPSALWTVEPVDGGARVRLRQAGGAECVRADTSGLSLVLAACDPCDETDPSCSIVDRFTVAQPGQIRLGGYCFAEQASERDDGEVPAAGLTFGPCTLAPSMLWNLSGRIEGGAGGALTRSFDSEAPPLAAEAIGDTAHGSQILDFYFVSSP